jgi:hypothetical protein
MEVVPSAVEGVTIDGPNAEGFHAEFLTLLAKTKPEWGLAAVEPYHVRISNKIGRAIVLYIIRSERLDTGYPIVGTVTRGHPGADRLLAGSTELELAGRAFFGPWNTPPTSLHIRVSLDAVVYENGEFRGPDVEGNFAKMKAHQEQIGALLADSTAPGPGSKQAVLARLDALRDSESFWDHAAALQLRFLFSLADERRAYFQKLNEMAADPPVWRN